MRLPCTRHLVPFSAILLFGMGVSAARAQETAAAPADGPLLSAPTHTIDFEVATFRPSPPDHGAPKLTFPPGGDGFSSQNRPMHDLIRYAFAQKRGGAYRISGQPSWVDDDLYDVQAKVAPEDIPEWQKLNPQGQKVALQQFLVQYLKLKFHQDTAAYPYYALRIAKGGPKMKESSPGDSFTTPDGHTVTGVALLWTGPGEITGQNVRMERLADQLSGHADRGVLNETGLTGSYDFVLRFNSAPNPNNPDGPELPFLAQPPDAATLSIISAVKQLGLEIVSTKGPMEGMVIDHIERPPSDETPAFRTGSGVEVLL